MGKVFVEQLRRHILTKMPRRKRRRYLFFLETMFPEPVERPLVPPVSFDLSTYTDETAMKAFRFDLAGIVELYTKLRLPEVIITKERYRATGLDALCLMLRRLVYPMRLFDMTSVFHRSEAAISAIFLHMIDLLDDKFGGLIYSAESLVRERIGEYCAAIHAKGAPLDSVFGFIDGTMVGICAPTAKGEDEVEIKGDACFSVHKRKNYLCFLAVTAPDGICVHFWGPVEGSRHDCAALCYSELEDYWGARRSTYAGRYVYGDLAIGPREFVMSGYKSQSSAGHSSDRRAFSKEISSKRVVVEWTFGELKASWAFINFPDKLKIGRSPVGKIVRVAMFLTNCKKCVGDLSKTSQYFGLQAPTLEQYLG